jgi:hypothetical protein
LENAAELVVWARRAILVAAAATMPAKKSRQPGKQKIPPAK